MVKWRNFKEEWHVRTRFYKNASFAASDQALLQSYASCSPYEISKRYLMAKEAKEVHVYGETPLSLFEEIAKTAEISPQDHVIDLGCGRGRGVFFLSQQFGCFAQGIDCIPEFIQIATEIKHRFNVANASFVCNDFFNADLSKATCIYLYGTCLEDPLIEKLILSFRRLPQKPKILTVSYPLSNYPGGEDFHVLKQLNASFPWGETQIYLQRVL